MAFWIELKPFEKVFIGGCTLTNSDEKIKFKVAGKAAVLRESKFLASEQANTPGKQLYISVQHMYLNGVSPRSESAFSGMSDWLKTMWPAAVPTISDIQDHIQKREFYKALNLARSLTEMEVNGHLPKG